MVPALALAAGAVVVEVGVVELLGGRCCLCWDDLDRTVIPEDLDISLPALRTVRAGLGT